MNTNNSVGIIVGSVFCFVTLLTIILVIIVKRRLHRRNTIVHQTSTNTVQFNSTIQNIVHSNVHRTVEQTNTRQIQTINPVFVIRRPYIQEPPPPYIEEPPPSYSIFMKNSRV